MSRGLVSGGGGGGGSCSVLSLTNLSACRLRMWYAVWGRGVICWRM